MSKLRVSVCFSNVSSLTTKHETAEHYMLGMWTSYSQSLHHFYLLWTGTMNIKHILHVTVSLTILYQSVKHEIKNLIQKPALQWFLPSWNCGYDFSYSHNNEKKVLPDVFTMKRKFKQMCVHWRKTPFHYAW